jgi:putative transposase
MARRTRPRGQAPSRGYRQVRASRAHIAKRAARQAQHTARVWAKGVVDHHQLIAVEGWLHEPSVALPADMSREEIGTRRDDPRSGREIPRL